MEIFGVLPTNPDGTKGVFLTGTSADFWEWIEFFQVCGMPFRAGYYRQQAEKGAYFIAQSPCHVDASFQPRGNARPRGNFLSPERREELAARVKASFPPIPRGARGRVAKDDARQQAPKPPEPRALTEDEADSMRRVMETRRTA